jgi:hypothetical protein
MEIRMLDEIVLSPRVRHSLGLSLLACAMASPAHAQRPLVEGFKRNVMSVEAGGPGGLYSLNYERRARERVMYRIGITAWEWGGYANGPERLHAAFVGGGGLVPILPGVLGPERFFEWGALVETGTHSRREFPMDRKTGTFLTLVPYAGLRHQPERGIWMVHVAATPLLPITGGYTSWASRSAELHVAVGVGLVF